MQQSNTKDILDLKPKCNAMQHNSAMGRYVRNALEEQVQRNATQQCNTKDIFKSKPKLKLKRNDATQHNSAMGRYVRNALEEQVQHNTMQPCNSNYIFELKPRCNATQQCNEKICQKCLRGTSATQCSATVEC